MEIWKTLKRYEGYEISNYGRVKRLSYTVYNGKGNYTKQEKILTNSKDGNSKFPRVHIEKNGIYSNVSLHKLLLENYFYNNTLTHPIEFYELKFIGDKDNYKVSNLKLGFKKNAFRLYDLEGNFLCDYPNIISFFREEIISSVLKALDGDYTIVENYQVRKLFDDRISLKRGGYDGAIKIPSALNKSKSDTVKVAKYFNDRLICVYNSQTDAAKNNHISIDEVRSSCDRNTVIHGFKFKQII